MARSGNGKSGGSRLKRPELYEELREDDMSKEKAARIANARASSRQAPSKKGGRRPRYEDWTVEQLYRQAQSIGIEGRSNMNKGELIGALRSR